MNKDEKIQVSSCCLFSKGDNFNKDERIHLSSKGDKLNKHLLPAFQGRFIALYLCYINLSTSQDYFHHGSKTMNLDQTAP